MLYVSSFRLSTVISFSSLLYLVYLNWSCSLSSGSSVFLLAPLIVFHLVDIQCTSRLFGPTGQVILF